MADWDVGRRGFIGSLLKSLVASDTPVVFHLDCEDADSGDRILDCVTQQFGMSLQRFSRWAASLPQSTLVLENVSPAAAKADVAEGVVSLQRIVSTLLDYCPSLSVLLVGRMAPPPTLDCARVEITPSNSERS